MSNSDDDDDNNNNKWREKHCKRKEKTWFVVSTKFPSTTIVLAKENHQKKCMFVYT